MLKTNRIEKLKVKITNQIKIIKVKARMVKANKLAKIKQVKTKIDKNPHKQKLVPNKINHKNNYPKKSTMNKFHSNKYKECNKKPSKGKKLNSPKRPKLKSLKQMKKINKLNQKIQKMFKNQLNPKMIKIRNKYLKLRNPKIKIRHLHLKINCKMIKMSLILLNKVIKTQIKSKVKMLRRNH